jgi:hypothetical protein
MKYAEIKQKLIDELTHSADAHDAGRVWDIDGLYDQLEGEVLRDDPGREFDKLTIALEFWAGWIDARNHAWKFYEGIEVSDWPRLARLIVEDLRADRETVDERVKRHFDYRCRAERPGVWGRLVGLLTGRGHKA